MSYRDDLRRDLTYALRQMRNAPIVTAVMITTIAIGIGATVTMAATIEALLLRPPAHVREPHRLMRVFLEGRDTFGNEGVGSSTNYPAFLDLEREVAAFDGVAAYNEGVLSLGVGADAEEVRVTLVSPSYFAVFGPTPALGRFFTADDGFPSGAADGGPPVAVLDHALWRRRFGSDSSVIGRAVRIGTVAYTVVAVGPPGFRGASNRASDAWLPIPVAAPVDRPMGWHGGRGATWIKIVGRLAPGVRRAIAEEQATTVFRRHEGGAGGFGADMRIVGASVIHGRGPDAPREVKVTLWLGGVSVLVLLIACANISNLLLARALVRGREIAVRVALGASRARLVRQMLAEAFLLAALGGAGAVLLAMVGRLLVGRLVLDETARGSPLDARLLALTAAFCLGTAILISLAPLLRSVSADLHHFLRGAPPGGARPSRLRTGLMTVQAALCTVLLIGAALFTTSLGRVRALDLGVDLDHTLQARFTLVTGALPRHEIDARYDAMLARLRSIPGVRRAAMEANGGAIMPYTEATRERSWWEMSEQAGYLLGVDHGYFRTLETRSLRGRDFDDRDQAGAQQVAIVTAPLATLLWPGGDALGKCLMVPERNSVRRDECLTVVGVLDGFWLDDILNRDRMLVYVPRVQRARAFNRPGIIYVSVAGERDAVAATALLVRQTIQGMRPDLPAADVTLLRDRAEPQMRPWRLGAMMFLLFGVIALAIALVGLYGVVSFAAAQRSRDVAIRVALGARPHQVLLLVAGEGVGAVLAGVLAGTGLALALGAWAGAMLFQTSPRDPAIYFSVGALLLTVAVLASLLPASQVLRRSPAVVLRTD